MNNFSKSSCTETKLSGENKALAHFKVWF